MKSSKPYLTGCAIKKYIDNLQLVNSCAGVDPEIIELMVAYAWMRLYNGKPVDFYGDSYNADHPAIRDFLKRNVHLDSRAKNFLASCHFEMINRGLCCVFNKNHLAHLLQTSLEKLYWLANDKKNHYTCFKIPKRNGKFRTIDSPKKDLKMVQRTILDTILHRVRLNSHAEGFVHQKSILTNAKRHVGQNIVIKMDLKDFFPSITFPRVAGMFEKIGYPRGVSVLLAKLTTHKGRMPIGAPTSPTISNIICRTLDKRFVRLGKKTKFRYSRYADDLAFSGNNPKIVKMIPFFKEIIADEGFEVNPEKLTVLRSGGRQKITGVVVNAKPNVARDEVRKLRAVLHNCRTKGVRNEMLKWARLEKKHPRPELYSVKTFKRSLLGKINFVKFVNPQKGKMLLSEFNKLTFT